MRIASLGALATAALIATGAAGHAQQASSPGVASEDPTRSLILSAPGAGSAKAESALNAPADAESDADDVLAAAPPAPSPEEGGVENILRSFAAPPEDHGDGLDPETARPPSAFLLDGISASLLRRPDETPPPR
jgi:hypothetical protein